MKTPSLTRVSTKGSLVQLRQSFGICIKYHPTWKQIRKSILKLSIRALV